MAVVRKVRLPYIKRNIGLLKIDFKLDPLIRLINSSLPSSTDINVLDQKNRIIYSTFTDKQSLNNSNSNTFSEDQGYYKTSIDNNTYYVTYERSPYSNLTYSLYIPQRDLLVITLEKEFFYIKKISISTMPVSTNRFRLISRILKNMKLCLFLSLSSNH